MLFLLACGPKPVAPKAELDTPEHHVTNGNKMLKAGKIDKAFKEFNRAKLLAPEYSPAHVGLGLVCGLRGDFEKGFASMDKAENYAKGKKQEVTVNVGYMRLYIMGKEKKSNKENKKQPLMTAKEKKAAKKEKKSNKQAFPD